MSVIIKFHCDSVRIIFPDNSIYYSNAINRRWANHEAVWCTPVYTVPSVGPRRRPQPPIDGFNVACRTAAGCTRSNRQKSFVPTPQRVVSLRQLIPCALLSCSRRRITCSARINRPTYIPITIIMIVVITWKYSFESNLEIWCMLTKSISYRTPATDVGPP